MKHVRAGPDQGDSSLATRSRIVEAVEIDLAALDPRVDGFGAVHPTLVGGLNWRKLDSPDKADHVRSGQCTGRHACQVAGLLQSKDQGDHIATGALPGGHNEDGLGVLPGNSL